MFKCKKCRTFVVGDANFCPQCGQSEPAELVCGKCRYEVAKQDRFCSNCNNELQIGTVSVNRPSATGTGPQLQEAMNRQAMNRQPVAGRPNWLWPETFFGNMLYLFVIAAGALFGLSLAGTEGAADAPPLIMALLMAGCALMVLTLWRIKFVSRGALTKTQPTSIDGESQPTGGISWSGIFWIFVTVALVKLIRQWAWDMP